MNYVCSVLSLLFLLSYHNKSTLSRTCYSKCGVGLVVVVAPAAHVHDDKRSMIVMIAHKNYSFLSLQLSRKLSRVTGL